MSFGKRFLGWQYYEMEYGYIFTGAYDPSYWGYAPSLPSRGYSPNGREKNNDGEFSMGIKKTL